MAVEVRAIEADPLVVIAASPGNGEVLEDVGVGDHPGALLVSLLSVALDALEPPESLDQLDPLDPLEPVEPLEPLDPLDALDEESESVDEESEPTLESELHNDRYDSSTASTGIPSIVQSRFRA